MSHTLLPPEISAALARQSGRPLRVTDPATNKEYVLVEAGPFDELTAIESGEAGPSADANGRPGGPVDFPTVGTPEWGQMNRRRADLIRKKLRGELTETERQQYEWLRQRSREALDAAFPRTGPASATRE